MAKATCTMSRTVAWTASLCLALGFAPAPSAAPLGIGRAPTGATLAARVEPIGRLGAELPAGAGSAATGAKIYAERCAACHGATGREGPDPVLVGGRGTLGGKEPVQTIGSYWPYATTVFDYIRRAMPFPAPGSLSDDDVYALTAFLLAANGIIGAHDTLDRASLPRVVMPNAQGFDGDPRPDTR